MKGVDRIYRQTFIDTCARLARAKLYTEKTAVTVADALNDRVIPFHANHGIAVQRVLTDSATECCGQVDKHAYQPYLAVEDIDHSMTKANSPQTNGRCERLHRTIEDNFYDIALRKKLCRSVEDLQTDLNHLLVTYNQQRLHSGRYCYGKRPMQTSRKSLHIAVEKTIRTPDSPDDTETGLSAAE